MRKYLFHIPYLARDNYSDNGYWHKGAKAHEVVSAFRKADIGYFNLVIEYLCLVEVYYRALYQAIVYDVYVLLLRYINSGET